MTDSRIIKGYKGIMDLDLRDIPEKYHKEMIENHKKDIREYKLEQSERPLNSRYENVVEKPLNYWKMYDEKLRQINHEKELEWFEKAKRKAFK